jgi:hypothetical protein
MLILYKDLWESDKILKVVSDNNWSDSDTDVLLDCALKQIKTLLLDCINQNDKCILLLDCNKGEVPPLFYLGKCVTFLLGIQQDIIKGVHFSMVYDKQKSAAKWIDLILKMYTPARPLFTVSSKIEINKLVTDKNIIDFNYKLSH